MFGSDHDEFFSMRDFFGDDIDGYENELRHKRWCRYRDSCVGEFYSRDAYKTIDEQCIWTSDYTLWDLPNGLRDQQFQYLYSLGITLAKEKTAKEKAAKEKAAKEKAIAHTHGLRKRV